MFFGRKRELEDLKLTFELQDNTITFIYGKTGIGKTALIKNFIRGKKCIYKCILPMEPQFLMKTLEEEVFSCVDGETRILVIEEIHNAQKVFEDLMKKISDLLNRQEKLMIILTSSSVSWSENSMVSMLGEYKADIHQMIKLKDISFVETARRFENFSIEDCLKVYTITGGVPKYLCDFDDRKSMRDNICDLFLKEGAKYRMAGMDILLEELREVSIYNSILWCLANEKNKLNDIHEFLGLGRDKISVYLKNLIERDIVEKVYSVDSGLKNQAIKGLYQISNPVVAFWYRYMYRNMSKLEMLEDRRFYNEYIDTELKAAMQETLIKVANEYMDFLNELDALPIKYTNRGRFWGKNGDLHIVASDEKKSIVGKCLYSSRQLSYEDYQELTIAAFAAKIDPVAYYLFSASGFDVRLSKAAENSNIVLIDINQM